MRHHFTGNTQPLRQLTPVSLTTSARFFPDMSDPKSFIGQTLKASTLSDGHSSDQAGQNADQKLVVLQNALSSVMNMFQNNRVETSQQIKHLQSQLEELQQHSYNRIKSDVSLPSLSEIISQEQQTASTTDFRANEIITLTEAAELLDLFTHKMSSHMFGYNFEAVSAGELWEESPLLLVSICAVACRHHPTLTAKLEQLVASLSWFASQLLSDSDSVSSFKEVERVILALVIASLWFEGNRLYLSIALQLARTWKIDEEQMEEGNNQSWKLWCLLYIVDGAQNLLSQKSPSVYKQSEPVILSSRRHLVESIENSKIKRILEDNSTFGKDEIATNKQLNLLNEVKHEKIRINSSQLQDIRLCGLTEYHMAIESIFHRKHRPDLSSDAISALLQPSSLGIPWKNNMDLDRWMVSWTITLQSIDVQNDAWCFKSTLLYYNFARMHINTDWLLNRGTRLTNGAERKSNWMEVWKLKDCNDISSFKNASDEIATSAASSLLKIATHDIDIRNVFQFLPNHVYIMMFYACIVILKRLPSLDISDTIYIKKLQKNFNLVKAFRDSLVSGNSSDPEFARKIVESTDELMRSFIDHCIKVSKFSKVQSSEVADIIQSSDHAFDTGSKRKTISAWPSINHGHP